MSDPDELGSSDSFDPSEMARTDDYGLDYDEPGEFECAFTGDCCMPGDHMRSECHSAEDMDEMRRSAMLDQIRAAIGADESLAEIRGRVLPAYIDALANCFAEWLLTGQVEPL